MLNNFDTRFDEDMRGKIQTLNAHLTDLMRRDGKAQDYIDSHLFTVRDVVNVASMIEKETSSAEEGYTIASVIYNRLFCWHGNPAYLNIDATIIYALDGKTDLTAEDLRVNSPYNTYTNVGLTPGPIANPGLEAIKAAGHEDIVTVIVSELDRLKSIDHVGESGTLIGGNPLVKLGDPLLVAKTK